MQLVDVLSWKPDSFSNQGSAHTSTEHQIGERQGDDVLIGAADVTLISCFFSPQAYQADSQFSEHSWLEWHRVHYDAGKSYLIGDVKAHKSYYKPSINNLSCSDYHICLIS